MDYNKVQTTDTTSPSVRDTVADTAQSLTNNKPRWVLYRHEEVDGRKTKIPYTKNNRHASVTDPNDWLTYDTVKSVQEDYDGIGFVFDGSVLGVDLDKCMDEEGIISDSLISAFLVVANTYAEVSPSGRGLHVLFKLSEPLQLKANRHGSYEVYTKGRYFTFTGDIYNDLPVRVISASEAEMLLAVLGYPWRSQNAPQPVLSSNVTTYNTAPDSSALSAVREKMFASQHGTKLQKLYNGDTSDYGGDISRADAALCRHLAYWTDGDRDSMKALWLESGLGSRDKTQERIDYVNRTIDFSLNQSSSDELILTTNDSSENMELESSVEGGSSSILPFKVLSADELMAMDVSVEWLVEDIFTKSALHMLAAPPHQGKTRIAMHIAVCVANGIPVFGSFAVKHKTNVLIVNEEDGLAMARSMLRSSIAEDQSHQGIHCIVDAGRKIDADWSQDIITTAKAVGAELVILDSLRALHNENENESHVMQPIMDALRAITLAGITVLFTHHDRKTQGGGGQSEFGMDRARGSSAITASVHGYMSCAEISRSERFLIRPIKLKADRPRQEPFTLRVEHLTPYDGRLPSTFVYEGPYDPDRLAHEDLEDRIVKMIAKNDNQLFTRKYFVSIGMVGRVDDKTLATALKRLVKGGYIRCQEYKELTEAEKSQVDGDVKRGNAMVYRALPKVKQRAETLESRLQAVETDLSAEVMEIEF